MDIRHGWSTRVRCSKPKRGRYPFTLAEFPTPFGSARTMEFSI